MQLEKKMDFAEIDEKGNLIIDLYQLFGEVNRRTETSITLPINYILEFPNMEQCINVEPELIGCNKLKLMLLNYKSNKFKLMLREES